MVIPRAKPLENITIWCSFPISSAPLLNWFYYEINLIDTKSIFYTDNNFKRQQMDWCCELEDPVLSNYSLSLTFCMSWGKFLHIYASFSILK